MYRIPVINQSTLFEDNNREALVQGKVEVLDPVSNNPLTIWSYSDDEYTVMANPVILDIEGRVPQTVFCDRIVYCRVYAFKGYDENNQPIYEFIRDFYAGENENSESREYVTGMEALKDLDPAVNTSVNVLGYYNSFDCPMRQYVWDPTCNQDADNGYVVASDVTSTGRWILQFTGEYLPSCYYGVYPGRLANINALLSYISAVGSTLTPTAPGVWFVQGTYGVDTNLQTTKNVMVDASTYFNCNYFYCRNLKVIGNPTYPICDFLFSDPLQEAHSSWFKTIAGFLNSGAKKYIIDSTNYFFNTTLNANFELTRKTIEGENRLPATYGTNGRITLQYCEILGNKIFNSTDVLTFIRMTIYDKWWEDPSSIDFYNKVSARTAGFCDLRLDNFENTNAYINAFGANGTGNELNLAGRLVNVGFTVPSNVTELRNVRATAAVTYNNSSKDLVIRDCQLDGAYITCANLSVYKSRIGFGTEPVTTGAWFYESEIYGTADWTRNVFYSFTDCNDVPGFNRATNNTSTEQALQFIRCLISSKNIISKNPIIESCTCNYCTIKIYPYKDNNVYKMQCWLENNVFFSTNPVEFTKFADDNVYEIEPSWTIRGNHFAGNSEGLRCRYWQHRTGSNYDKTFIKLKSATYGVDYSGNTGDCPANDMRGVMIVDNTQYNTETVTYGSSTYTLYKYTSAHKRCMPFMNAGDYWWQLKTKDANTLLKYFSWTESPYNSLTYNLFIQTNWYLYNLSRGWADRDGDLFDLAIVIFNDYMRIVQRGDGDENNGVVGRIV